MKEEGLHFETLQLHAGFSHDPQTHAFEVPIYQTASYAFDDTQYGAELFALTRPGNIYTRIMNPTTDVLEKRLAALEGGVGALATSSGMAAILYAIENLTSVGDHIISLSTIYGGTYTLLSARMSRIGVDVTLVGLEDLTGLEQAITDKTRLIFFESIGNPEINIPDIEGICAIAHKHGLPVVVDNTFGTPYLIALKDFGVDIIVHSLTKYIGGHGNSIGGAIVDLGMFDWHNPRFPGFTTPDAAYHGMVYADIGPGGFITKARVQLLRDTGACISPFNAFLFLQGIETLALRVQKHCRNAERIAEYLQEHPKVSWVSYPYLKDHPQHDRAVKYFPKGVGGILSFGVKGGRDAAGRLMDRLQIFTNIANVADTRSMVIHPATTTHGQLNEQELRDAGVKPDAVRMSVGIEDVEDLIADLEQGFAGI